MPVDTGYIPHRDFVRPAKVTNDVAEIGIAMMQAIAHAVNDEEEQLQWSLLEMEAYRRRL